MLCGRPRSRMICSSTRVTRRLAKLVSASSAKHSRVKVSTTPRTTHGATGRQHISSKVQRPFLIRCDGDRRLHAGPYQALSLAALHAESRLAVHPPNTFVIHLLA